MFTMCRLARRGLFVLLPTMLAANQLSAQTFATVKVYTKMITNGIATEQCDESWQPLAKRDTPDSIEVLYFSDAKFTTPAETPAEIVVLVDGAQRGASILQTGRHGDTLQLKAYELSGRTVSIARKDAGLPLCARVPRPIPVTNQKVGEPTTSFIADGAVGVSLRTGALSGGGLTGSLGIDHISPKKATEPNTWTKWLLATPRLDGEHLRTYITLASSVDTLAADDRSTFIQALLLPAFGAGQVGSGVIDYHPYVSRGAGAGTQGGRVILVITKSRWQYKASPAAKTDKDTTNDVDRFGRVSIASLDWRYRWAFLDRPQDERGNTFTFATELGATVRAVSGEEGRDPSFRRTMLGSSNDLYPGVVFAFDIRLRQVTATLDVPFLLFKRKAGDPDPGALRGIQPVFGIRFDAPFFTF